MIFRYYVLFLLVFVIGETSTDVYSDNPRILIQEGNMIISPGKNKNITFVTSKSGSVNWKTPGDKTGVRLGLSSTAPDPDIDSRISRLENLMEGTYEGRIADLETSVERLNQLQSERSEEGSDQIPAMRTRLRRVRRILENLRSLLNQDHCAEAPCRNGGSCINTFQGPVCQCPKNWEGSTCEEDVNECARFAGTDLGCQNGATCRNEPGTYSCHCPPNWYGIHCTRRNDDCSSGSSDELCGHGTCVDQSSGSRGYTCICHQGWKTDGIHPACIVDVNECESPSPPCSKNPFVQCINSPGSFTCQSCPAGYTGNGFYCQDINECLINNGGCSQNPSVQCINTLGSKRCGECPAGYQGNGQSCTFMGPCHINNGGCSPMAACVAVSGIVQCFCRPGYSGTGVGPFGCVPGGSQTPNLPMPPGSSPAVSPCASSPCLNGGICIPTASNFICNCIQGYTGTTCSAEINECDSHPCLNGGTCIDMTNGYRCTCDQGFHGDQCEEEIESCGGFYYSSTGTIEFPAGSGTLYDHGLDCHYTIEVGYFKVMNISFESFSLEDSVNCDYDYLEFRSGMSPTSGNAVGRYCGSTLPKPFQSVYNRIHVVFHSDSSINDQGFSFSWNETSPVCGGPIINQTHGNVYSPGYPGNYPSGRDCTWTIYASPNKRVQFHFAALQIEQHLNCSFDYLRVRDGEMMNYHSHILATFCNSTSPPPLTSSSNVVSLDFHSDPTGNNKGFHITWSEVPGVPGCGGLFSNDAGQVFSPSHPETYVSHLECDYIIRAPGNVKVKLSFVEFSLEYDHDCMFDYIEIRDGGKEDSPLLGRYCGFVMPPDFTSSGNELFVRFKSDHSVEMEGFRANYEVVCGGEFNTPNGVITSPYHPRAYPHSKVCDYLISQPIGSSIHLEFLEFDIEGHHRCVFDYLEIRDGDNENSTLIGHFCGDPSLIPPPIDSTHNYLWIRFATDSSVSNRGFMLNFTTSDVICGGILKEDRGLIESPIDAENFPNGIECKWIISGYPGSIIRLTWSSFGLVEYNNCEFDFVEIYDNYTGSADSKRSVGRYCGTRSPPTMTSVGNTMTIVYKSESTIPHEGFVASYDFLNSSRACGGKYFSETGFLTSPGWPTNYPHELRCEWTITVAPGQQILLNVTNFNLEGHQECDYDYLEIRNGGYSMSPLIGRYCGSEIPPLIPSSSHQLHLKLKTDDRMSGRGFRIYWDGTSTGCGGHLTGPTGSLASPSYPLPYHHAAECIWEVHVSKGSKVQLVFTDLDLEDTHECSYDYVEIWDISSPKRDLMGRYCRENPPILLSSGNAIRVKFRSDISVSSRGFHLHYLTVCDNELYELNGIIESPNFPEAYPHNRDCTWKIHAPIGNKINITFSHFHIESHSIYGNESTCEYDYLKIYKQSYGETTNLATYCGNEIPERFQSDTNVIYANFKSDASVSHNGFRFEYETVGCGGSINGRPYGWISSPNYPNNFPLNTRCVWRITTDLGTNIELNILDLDVEGSQDCMYDSLKVYGGPDVTSPMLTQQCHKRTSTMTVRSMGNHMYIVFQSDSQVSGKGFRAKFTAKHGGCGGEITAPSGFIYSPNYPNSYDNLDDCAWLLKTDPGHAIRLSFLDFDVEPHTNCSYDYVAIFDGNSTESTELLRHCGQNVPSPINSFISSGNMMYIRLKADGSASAKGFSANYTRTCGGERVISDGKSGELLTPNYPHNWLEEGECAWILQGVKETDRITLTFHHMEIFDLMANMVEDTFNCSNTRIEVRDGADKDAPLVGRFCNQRIPPSITSRGNFLFVNIIKTNHYPEGSGFRATYTVENSACGGELKSAFGRFTSPNYPETYQENVECVWTIGGWPGNTISLGLVSFDIEESEGCNRDYLEIHKDGPEGPLLGHFCGDEIPSNITSYNKLWIKFNSDSSGGGRGFIAEYALVSDNEIMEEVEGEISSPLYPSYYKTSTDKMFTYRILAREGMNIEILFKKMSITQNVGDTCLSYLKINDGYDEDSSAVFEGCGNLIPNSIRTTGNVAFITFFAHGHDLFSGSKFLLSWSEVPANTYAALIPYESNPCNQRLIINETIRINNVNYPIYNNSENCIWILESMPDTRIKVVFTYLGMESTNRCRFDSVTVWDGMYGTQRWNRTGRYCRRSQIGTTIYSSGSFLKIIFKTDGSVVRGKGFIAMASPVCGGFLSEKDGVLKSPNYPRDYPKGLDCSWVIGVRPSRTIRFHFESLDVTASDNNCPKDYLIVRNGESNLSPLMLLNDAQGPHQNGRLCGSQLPSARNTSGNHLRVTFITASGYRSTGSGFKLVFSENSHGCGGRIFLNENKPEYIFNSPNYPNVPHTQTECVWLIMAKPGKRVQIDILENFDIRPSRRCSQAGLEIRDGGTETSPLIGTYCRARPSTQASSGSIIYVKYYTFVSSPNNGFKAKASPAKCGGTHYIRNRFGYLTLFSPNHPHSYENNLDCEWRLIARKGHFLKIHFIELDLPSAVNCSTVDHISITDIGGVFEAFNLGTFCGRDTTSEITTLTNNVTLRFKSDGVANDKTGFLIRVNSSRTHCGFTKSGTSGIVQSPGYPNGDSTFKSCMWKLIAPEGHAITFRFEDLDFNYNCRSNIISVFSLHDQSIIPELSDYANNRICGGTLPDEPFVSRTNILVIHYQSFSTAGRRGFKISWTSEPTTPPCGGELSSSGYITPILNPTSGNYSLSQFCVWEHQKSNENSTVVFKSKNVQIRPSINPFCFPDKIYFDSGAFSRVKYSTCEESEFTYMSPDETVRMLFTAKKPWGRSYTGVGFNASYNTYPCGGVLTSSENGHIISTPNYNNHYPPNIDCVWRIEFNEDEQIQLDFNDFELQDSGQSCKSGDFLEIFNGPTSLRHPQLWEGCGVHLPERKLVSMSNGLWLHFHSNEDTTTGRGFSITATPLKGGCGGILHGQTGSLSMPSSEGSKYGNGIECIWDIRAEMGYRIVVNFTDRFEIETSPGCTKDYLQIFSWNEDLNDWTKIGDNICGRQIPSPIKTGSRKARIIFRTDNEIRGDGFKINWKMECGGVFTTKTGEFSSPGYPNKYDDNLLCDYHIAAPPGDYVSITFHEPFEIEEGALCKFDSLKIIDSKNRTLRTFCRDIPDPVSYKGPLLLRFKTDLGLIKKGFKVSFEVQECGGNITVDGTEIQSPLHSEKYHHNSNCTWYITAPREKSVQLKFDTLDLETERLCSYDRVSVFDGHTLNSTFELAKFCGTQTELPILKSSANQMTVQFFSDYSFSSGGFKAVAVFSYGPSSGCGGLIEIKNEEPVTIKSLDADGDGTYEIDLNCQWAVFAPADKIIQMTFSVFDIESETNATYTKCWDFIKIYDGHGPFSPLMGEFCGSTAPTPEIKSSRNHLWINFFSDSTNVRSGFVASLKLQDPVCGSHVALNATSEPQTIMSPGYPGDYSSNLRCRWVIDSSSSEEEYYTIHLKFLDLNIPSSLNCEGDKIRISEIMPYGRRQHEVNSTMITSSYSEYRMSHRWRNNYQHQDSNYCGQTIPPDFYSMGSTVQVDFISDHVETSKGFKLEYSVAGCNRTYDRKNGLILSPRFPGRVRSNTYCDFAINTTEGRTISLYFRIFNLHRSRNCTDSFLEVRDGPSSTSPLLSRMCGYGLPPSIHSSGRYLRFRLVNDLYSSGGYEATYVTSEAGPGCGGSVIDSRGVVTSPNYPEDYPHDTDCSWTLSVPRGNRIQVRLVLGFGAGLSCARNYLELFDKNPITHSRTLVSRYCGEDQPAIHNGLYNSVELHYVTAANNTRGWKANFQYVLN